MSEVKVERLSAERERILRNEIAPSPYGIGVDELLAELDAVRAELASARADRDLVESEFLKERGPALAEAEQRGYSRCQADAVAWLRKRPEEVRCVMSAGTALLSAAHHIDKGAHIGASERAQPTRREG